MQRRPKAVLDRTSRVVSPPAPASEGSGDGLLHVSVVIPCLNEAQSIGRCVREARRVLAENDLDGEVIVVDNGSDDGSGELAALAGARVLHEPNRGYGAAYVTGLAATRGANIVMVDADLTYDLNDIPRFVRELDNGADLVVGDRMDNIHPGAMPWLHRYVGNPVLTGILNLFFGAGVRDAHCGMRAVRREVIPRLDLRTTGMEFASEMLIRAAKEDLEVRQIPIEYRPRTGESKLSSFRDGWRHLRVLLLHSPTYLFLIPGALLSLVGLLAVIAVLAEISVFGRSWNLHAMIVGVLLVVVGVQVLALGACARTYATCVMGERDPFFERLQQRLRLEHGLVLGAVLLVAGLVAAGLLVGRWAERGFGELSEEKGALLAAMLVIVGIQIFFSSFLLSMLGSRKSEQGDER